MKDLVSTNLDNIKSDKQDSIEEKLKKEIIQTEHLLNYIINYNKSGVAVLDTNMNYIYVSNKFHEQFMVNQSNVIGKNHYEVFFDLPEKFKDAHKKALQGEVVKSNRDIFIRSDNQAFWTQWECRPWFDIDENIGGIIIYSEIINERINYEILLEEKNKQIEIQKNKVDTVIKSLREGIVLTDKLGIITFVNERAAQLAGYKSSDILGLPINEVFEIIEENTREKVACLVSEIITHETEVSNNVILLSKDGNEYYIEYTISGCKNSKHEIIGVVFVLRNLTHRIQRKKEVDYLLTHDSSTGLYNRRFFIEELVRLDIEKYYPLCLIMLDINGLKIINNAYGIVNGDNVIKIVSDMISTFKGDDCIISRYGGDEFAIIVPNASKVEVEKLKKNIEEGISKINFNNLVLSLSFGISFRNNNSKNIAEFVNDAENDMYKSKLVEGMNMRNNTIKALLETLTNKYTNERVHSIRVSQICKKFGLQLKLNSIEAAELEMAGMFHDIGKISIPDAILGKPGRLTNDEYEVMKTHAQVSYQILKAADKYSRLADYALSHHERWDGKGYPNGLKENQIPIFSRIISIADAYEAMTTNRVYRKRMSKEEAVNEILKCSGTQFDPNLVNIFVNKILRFKHA